MNDTVVDRLAFFLLKKTGSVSGKWTGRVHYTEQRMLFGHNQSGWREIEINGCHKRVQEKKKVCRN